MVKQHGKPRSSYHVAYVLCLLAGWMGAHRYYLRRWGTAFLYTLVCGLVYLAGRYDLLVLQLTAVALLAFGVFFDLMILPLLVRQRRDIEAGIPLPPETAPWASAESKSWWNRFQLLLRIGILVFTPALTIVVATSLGQTVIVVLVFMMLAFALLVGSIGRALYALEELGSVTQRVPLLPVAIGIVSGFQKHYSGHRARSVFYYLFYPVLGPLFMLFSRSARSEFRPYLSLFSLVVIVVLFQNFLNYNTIFPASYFFHNTSFGLNVCLFIAIGGIGLFFVCVVPMVSSSFYLSMTGRGISLRFSAALALVLAAGAMLWATSATSVTFRGSLTATEKLNNPDFKNDFDWMNETYLIREMDERTIDRFKGNVAQIRAWSESFFINEKAKVKVVGDSTAWYRDYMSSCLRAEEAAAYRVVEIDPPDGSGQEKWLAVQFVPQPIVGFGGTMGECVLLYVISPDKALVRRWSDLPQWFNEVFENVDRENPPSKFSPQKVTRKALIEDFELGKIRSFEPWPIRQTPVVQ